VEAIPQIIESVIDAVIGAIPLLIQAGIDLLISLVQNLPKIILTIVDAIPKIITSIVNALVGNIDKIIMAGVQLFISLIENLPTIIIEIVKAVPQIVKGLIDAFKNLIPEFINMGKNLLLGLKDGIVNAVGAVLDAVKNVGSTIVNGVKGFFGIRSPSRVFAEIGEFMAQGLGVGFEDEMDDVCDAMQKAIPTSLDGPDIDIDGNIHTALDGAGTAVSLADIGLKLDGIAAIMIDMFPAILEALNIKVVLDDGTLVGRLAPEIDRNLGLLRKRGLAY